MEKTETEDQTNEERVENNLIDIEHFAKVKLKVGQVLEAEKIEKSKKLLKLQVSLGDKDIRQIIAGIALKYEPEELIGRKVAVVSNLKPAKLMGNESQGMLLAVSDEMNNLELLQIPIGMPAGAEIR